MKQTATVQQAVRPRKGRRMISVTVMKEEGIVIIEPSSPLEQSDFETLAKDVDALIEEKGTLKGIIIHTKLFPGWEDFGGFTHHMKFVKEHHKKVTRVAIVTDSRILSIAPSLAKHFVSAEIKHFDYKDMEDAKQWVQEAV